MQAFLFAVNATLPIIITVGIGYIIKRIGIIDEVIAVKLNRLVFRVFLPCMLFLNVYNITPEMDIGLGYIAFGCAAVLVIFFVSLIAVPLLFKRGEVRAVLMQATFRSNFALIGIPLAESLFTGEGAAVASLLSAFSIPIFNILAVLCFSLFSGSEKPRITKILLGIVKNPLIIAIALGGVCLLIKNLTAGLVHQFLIEALPPVYKVLGYLSSVATPLALISLGAQFNFTELSGHRRELIFGTAMRVVITPLICLMAALAIGKFNGAHFAAFVALFASPIAVSSVPMAQELGGDGRLAGQLVVSTTLVSAITVFIFTMILKQIGVF